MKTYNRQKVLMTVVGVLTTGMMLNLIYDISPSTVSGIDKDTFNREYAYDLVYANNTSIQETILIDSASISTIDLENERKINNIRRFLEKRNSPLAQYANEFVLAANHYGIDYRLVAAISIIESSGGLHNFKPYNAWGWGKSGFDNWIDGIWSVSKGLSNYYARGLDTPLEIGRVYCPPSSSSWSSKVSYVMNQIGD